MTEPVLLVSERDNILDVVLNRPEKYNAMNIDMANRLFDASQMFAERRDLRVMLIRANGRYFSAGADLNGGLLPDPEESSPSGFRRSYRTRPTSLHPLFDELEAIEKPIVVAHHAPCLGGALEMSLSCDFRLASSSAQYSLPETSIGAIPGSGGTSRLTRLVGPHWARWLIMANLPVSAERALMIGLVHEIYPDDVFEQRVWDFCIHLSKQPPETLAAAKLAIELAADLDRAQARNVERLAVSSLVMGEEFRTLVAEMRTKIDKRKKP
jgi:enoyl-CoA hydratase/carnithine racemase